MDDLTKLLDGSIEDVKTGLAGKSHDDLLKLKTAEEGGKTRRGVLDAIDAALANADEKRVGGKVAGAITTANIAADLDTSGPANIEPASEFSPSGAPRQVTDIPVDNPAIDNDPRAGTTVDQNRIDMNDPTRLGHEVVEEMLKANA